MLCYSPFYRCNRYTSIWIFKWFLIRLTFNFAFQYSCFNPFDTLELFWLPLIFFLKPLVFCSKLPPDECCVFERSLTHVRNNFVARMLRKSFFCVIFFFSHFDRVWKHLISFSTNSADGFFTFKKIIDRKLSKQRYVKTNILQLQQYL